MSDIIGVLQSDDPISYKLGYSAGTTLTVGTTAWVIGKVLHKTGSLIKPSAEKTDTHTFKIAKTLQSIGNILSFPGDQICIGGKMAIGQFLGMVKRKQKDEGSNQTSIPSDDTPALRAQFQDFISPDFLSPEVANIISGASEEELNRLYFVYYMLNESDRLIMEPLLQNYRDKITCMTDIFLIIYGWQAGMEHMEIVHEVNGGTVEGESRGNDELSDDIEEGEELTYEQIMQMKHEGKLTYAQVDFLLSAGNVVKG